MLAKLLKYDLKWCYKTLVIFYILTIISAIITRFIEEVNNSFIFLILDKIFSAITIALLINILINSIIRIWARFINNIYKDESYLTHTLPVKKSEIFLSKILTSIITFTTSFIVIITSLVIVCYTRGNWTALKQTIENTAILFDTSTFSFVIAIICAIFFEVLFMILAGILGIVIGHRSNNFRIVKSVILRFYIVYYSFSNYDNINIYYRIFQSRYYAII